MTSPVTFAECVPIKPLTSHTYSLHLEDEWVIGTVPNGGYTTSALLIAARVHMQSTHSKRNQPNPMNLHLEFLRRTAIGPATITVRDVKLGSRISNLHLTMYQHQPPNDPSSKVLSVIEGYITMTSISTEEGLSLPTSYNPQPPILPFSVSDLKSPSAESTHYKLRANDPFASFRLAAQNCQMFLLKRTSRSADRPRSINDQVIRFTPLKKNSSPSSPSTTNPQHPNHTPQMNGRWTNDALGFLVDMFPQIVEQYINTVAEEATITAKSPAELLKIQEEADSQRAEPRARFWYPTLSLTLNVKKLLPDEGVEFLFVRTKAKSIENGRFDLDVEVWDQEGGLVASSYHSSLVVDASRNTTRSNGGGGKKDGSKL